MLRGARLMWMMFVAFAGCSGGGGNGDACGGNSDCDGTLQCLNRRCAPHCVQAPDCGDGYSCDDLGFCQKATGQRGDSCQSEVDCAAGLSCQIDGAAVDNSDSYNRPLSSCATELATGLAGATCNGDIECRHGTCALGHCIDLCRQNRDCVRGNRCALIPSVLASNASYFGCLPSTGAVTWSIPVTKPSVEILLPIPNVARSAELVMTVGDLSQKVGVTSVLSPAGHRLYTLPCASNPLCDPNAALDDLFANEVRHQPGFGQSVLVMPSGLPPPPPGLPLPADKLLSLQPGVYRIEVSSLRANNTVGTAIPRVTAVVQLDAGAVLDLHFFFLDLTDHPCAAMTNNAPLDATAAQASTYFQKDYLDELRTVFFAGAELRLGTTTYDNLTNQPTLDRLDVADVADAGTLLAFGKYATGINVFFVRTLAPVGLQAFGPNPGPAALGGTKQSGIVIGLDTLCYRTWPAMARLTAHMIAHYMGLYHTVELDNAQHPTWLDSLSDTATDGSSNNLMFSSERAEPGAGTQFGPELTPQQRDILHRSAVLH